MDGKVILEFRVWNSGTSLYEWSRAWTDRFKSCDPIALKLDDSGNGYGGFYPETTKIRVRNDDRFWDRLEQTAPQLADGTADSGTEPYRTGFRGRLVRLIENCSGTERILFTGAVDDVSVGGRLDTELSIIGLQRLAMEQQGDSEKIDDVTVAGAWSTATALYRSRTAIGNGSYDIECFRHKRAVECFKRTKMPRMDASVVAANMQLSTSDSRRTATNVSLPDDLDWNGFVWGDPDDTKAYLTARSVSANDFYLYRFDYDTGEVTLLATLDDTQYHRVAICGLLYNGDQGTGGQIAIPTWKHTGTGRGEVPWLFVYDIALGTNVATDLQAWCTATLSATGTSGATKSFDEFFFWAPARRAASSAGLWGTLWFIVDTRFDNRIIEVSPWGAAPALLNDSLDYYIPGTHGVPAGTAFWPAACAEYAAADPTATPAIAGACVLYCYACTQDYSGVGGYHDLLLQLTFGGVTWSAAVTIDSDSVNHALAICGCVVETTVGVIYTRQGAVNDTIVSLRFADFGTPGTQVVREPESFVGLDGYFYDYDGRYGPQFILNYVDDRIYYGTGNVNAPDNWNVRLRSFDATWTSGPGSAPTDCNINPDGGSVGDPPTDQAAYFQFGTCLLVRYVAWAANWELHGILKSPLESDVLMTYSKTYYPCVTLFDVRGKSLWELRRLLAEVCCAYFAYDGEGNLRLFQRATMTSVVPWSTDEPVVESLGLHDVITRLSSIPYRVTTAEDSREAEVIQQAVDPLSTGCLLNIKTGRVTATATYRLTFTDASPSTDYSVDKLTAGAWANVGIGTRSTTFTSSDDFTISPDCFAGTFKQGDTFTFCVYARLPQLERQGNYAKVEAASSTAETKWGRTEATIDNPFLPRAQTIDFLTRVLTWQSVPHRRFSLGVPPWFYAAELEARTLVSAGTTYGGILIGWRRQIGKSARKELTLVEA